MLVRTFRPQKEGIVVAVTDDLDRDTATSITTIARNQERLRRSQNDVVGVLGVMDGNITQLREDVNELQGDRPNWQRCWGVAFVVWVVLMIFCSWAVFRWHWDGFIEQPVNAGVNYVRNHRMGVALKDIFAFSSLIALLVLLLMSFHERRVSSSYDSARNRLRRNNNDAATDDTADEEDEPQPVADDLQDQPTPAQTLAAIEADPALLALLQGEDSD